MRAYLPGDAPLTGPHVLTDDNGGYQISGLEPGSYNVVFYDVPQTCEAGIDLFATQWFNGQADQNLADLVVVADGATTPSIDAALDENEAIVGRTTDVAGQPIGGICVQAENVDTSEIRFTRTTDVDAYFGYYLLRAPAGRYKLRFYDQGAPCYAGQYLEQWYRDKPDRASADIVQVLAQRATFDIDVVMYDVPTIGGHVQDEAGQPIAGLCVVANPAAGPLPAVPPFATTDAAGNYEFDVMPGDWKVQFFNNWTECTFNKYVLQLWNDKPGTETADVIHVERGAHITGINATMKLLAPPVSAPPPPPPPPAPPPPAVKCNVPPLRGTTLAKAKRLLRRNHCKLGRVTRKRSARRLAGRVLRTKPRAQLGLPAGTKVTLVVGKRN